MLKIIRTRDVKKPERGTKYSAGIDFFVPNDFKNRLLGPGDDILIPSGIKAKVPHGYMMVALEKSGVATKKRLAVGAKVIDEDYQGEIHIHVYNTSTFNVMIEPGMKIVQFVIVPVSYESIFEVESEEVLFKERTKRGSGGFGSTGDK